MTHHYDESLDATGLVCPEPLVMVRNRLRTMNSGQVLWIQATDPSTTRDFANLCRFMGHTLVHQETHPAAVGERLEFWLQAK